MRSAARSPSTTWVSAASVLERSPICSGSRMQAHSAGHFAAGRASRRERTSGLTRLRDGHAAAVRHIGCIGARALFPPGGEVKNLTRREALRSLQPILGTYAL